MSRYLFLAYLFPIVVFGESSNVESFQKIGLQNMATANVHFVIYIPKRLELTVNSNKKIPSIQTKSNTTKELIIKQNNDVIIAVP